MQLLQQTRTAPDTEAKKQGRIKRTNFLENEDQLRELAHGNSEFFTNKYGTVTKLNRRNYQGKTLETTPIDVEGERVCTWSIWGEREREREPGRFGYMWRRLQRKPGI